MRDGICIPYPCSISYEASQKGGKTTPVMRSETRESTFLFVFNNFEQVIGPDGLLKRKTRILCTNSVAYLSQMDQIFVMKEGRVSEQGTYENLLAEGGEFADFLIQYLSEEGDKENLDPQAESELEDLKTELEKALGKDKLERRY